jgi:hypothetical protein
MRWLRSQRGILLHRRESATHRMGECSRSGIMQHF